MAVVGFNGRGERPHRRLQGSSGRAVRLRFKRARSRAAEDVQQEHMAASWIRFPTFASCSIAKDIDAISIATPNHTHSLIGVLPPSGGQRCLRREASQPECVGRPATGQRRGKYKRIIQCGTQSAFARSLGKPSSMFTAASSERYPVRRRHLLQAADVDRQARQAARDPERS